MAAAIGALRVTLGADTAQFQAGMRRAQMTARTTGQSIERSMSGMSLRTSQAFAGLRVAASGLGIVLGASLLIGQARAAFEFAAGLSETSRSIGVTVEQLQVLRRAATENGASIEGMERALAFLNRTLGEAKRGSAAAVHAFTSIGITPAQIASFQRGGDALAAVTDGLNKFTSDAALASHGRQLFGRGVAEMIPMLRQGSSELSRLTEEMRRTGLVTEEQARRADEAEDSLGRLGDVIRINLASALVDALPLIESVVRALSAIATTAGEAIRAIREVGNTPIPVPGGAPSSIGQVASYMFMPGLAVRSLVGSALGTTAPAPPRRSPLASLAAVTRRTAGTDNTDRDLAPHGGGGGGRASHAAEQAARRRHEVEAEFARARMDELRAQQEATTSAEERARFAEAISYIEQGQMERDLELARFLKERTQLESDAVAEVRTRTFHLQRDTAAAEEAERITGERVEMARGNLDLALQMARGEADLAETVDDRRESQLRILALQQQQERLELEAVYKSRESNDAQAKIALARLDMLDSIYQQQAQGVMNANRGPLGDFLHELPTTAARANEALQRVAADGLASITDGLADAIMMTRSWGDVFKNVAKQIISDLLRIQIQRTIIGPLTGALSGLFGGAAGGGGSGLGAIGASIGTRAAGGPVLPGRTYLIGEKGPELLRMGGAGQVISNDNIGGGGIVIHQTFAPNFAGNAATKQEMVQLASMVKPMAIEAFKDFAGRR